MKEFIKVVFDLKTCQKELAAFRALLDGKQELDEAADVKPFFEANRQVAALIGPCYSRMRRCDGGLPVPATGQESDARMGDALRARTEPGDRLVLEAR
jgi:hypothetical protein